MSFFNRQGRALLLLAAGLAAAVALVVGGCGGASRWRGLSAVTEAATSQA